MKKQTVKKVKWGITYKHRITGSTLDYHKGLTYDRAEEAQLQVDRIEKKAAERVYSVEGLKELVKEGKPQFAFLFGREFKIYPIQDEH